MGKLLSSQRQLCRSIRASRPGAPFLHGGNQKGSFSAQGLYTLGTVIGPMGLIVDIGCGARKQPGTIGIDRRAIRDVDLFYDFGHGLFGGHGSKMVILLISPSRT